MYIWARNARMRMMIARRMGDMTPGKWLSRGHYIWRGNLTRANARVRNRDNADRVVCTARNEKGAGRVELDDRRREFMCFQNSCARLICIISTCTLPRICCTYRQRRSVNHSNAQVGRPKAKVPTVWANVKASDTLITNLS